MSSSERRDPRLDKRMSVFLVGSLLFARVVVAQLDRPVPVMTTTDNANFSIPFPMAMGGAG